jgi:hypothetical protein
LLVTEIVERKQANQMYEQAQQDGKLVAMANLQRQNQPK